MEHPSCCFIGHRKLPDKERIYPRAKQVIETLIVENGVRIFHFGSRSEFDDLCHRIVTELQSKYPNLVRVNYHCKSEYAVKKEEKEKLEETYRRLLKREVTFKAFEQAKSSDRVQKAGKASYVERNQDMINDSDYCVFFYTDTDASRGKSGTKLAYAYAVRKKKRIINLT